MNKLKQNLITIGGAMVLFIIFLSPLIKLDIMLFGSDNSIEIGDIGTDIPSWINPFLYTFPFFLTLLEFFFKKPLLERRPYLYIIGFFILISLIDEMFLLATLAVIIIGAIPGTLYHLIKSRSAVASPKR